MDKKMDKKKHNKRRRIVLHYTFLQTTRSEQSCSHENRKKVISHS